MTILLLTDGIWPLALGGMQKHSFYTLKYLLRSGVKVSLVMPHTEKDSEQKLFEVLDFDTEIQKDTLEVLQVKMPLFKAKFPGHYLMSNIKYSQAAYAKVQERLVNYDLIYAQGFSGISFFKNRQGVPVVSHLHGFEMYQQSIGFKDKMQKQMLCWLSDSIIKNSDYLFSFGGKISEILRHLGVPDAKILKTPIGIDERWLIREEEIRIQPKRTFVFIGRYERRKAAAELSVAIKDLLRSEEEFQFHFIGEIPLAEQIAHHQVYYHGVIRDEDKIKGILDQSDVLVCPSYSEGMPTVIMEAMARGLAIAATNVGAVSEQVDESNGIILQSSHPEAITAGLRKMINLENQAVLSMKINGLRKVRANFLWSKVILDNIQSFDFITQNQKISH